MEIFGYKLFKKKMPDTVFFNKKKTLTSIFDTDEELTIFDVGANVGQSHEFFRGTFPESHITCFEPVKDTFDKLKSVTSGDVKCDCYMSALSSETGEMEMCTYEHSNQNSASALNEDALSLKNNLHRDIPQLFDKPLTRETVKVDTLDNFTTQNNVDYIDILKIDVQSYEDEVLRGAKSLLSRQSIGVIFLEIIFEDIYNRPLSFGLIESILDPENYVLWDIAHIYKDLNINRTCFVDAVYISKNLFEAKKTRLYPALKNEAAVERN